MSTLRWVKDFLGGQTETLGKMRWEMGRVVMVVVMGLDDQSWRAWEMSRAARLKPRITTTSQVHFTENWLVEKLRVSSSYLVACSVQCGTDRGLLKLQEILSDLPW